MVKKLTILEEIKYLIYLSYDKTQVWQNVRTSNLTDSDHCSIWKKIGSPVFDMRTDCSNPVTHLDGNFKVIILMVQE